MGLEAQENSKKLLYTVKETATVLGCNIHLVYDLINKGLLPAMKLGSLKIRLTSIEEFLKKYDFAPQELIEKLSSIDWKSRIGDIAKTVTSGIGNVMDVAVSAVSSVVSGVTTASLAIIFSVYVLLNKEKLKNQITKLIKRFIRQDIYDKGAYVLSVVNDCFHRFIVGQCTEAVILGALCAIGMLILKLPYALMMGAVTAFTALIPVVGALIGGAIGAFLILMQSPVKALIFLVFIILLQQIEGDLIYPRVVGNSIGLPGIWVFVAVTVGGGVLGVFGMMLGVPVAAAAYRLLKAEVNKTKTCAPEKTE